MGERNQRQSWGSFQLQPRNGTFSFFTTNLNINAVPRTVNIIYVNKASFLLLNRLRSNDYDKHKMESKKHQLVIAIMVSLTLTVGFVSTISLRMVYAQNTTSTFGDVTSVFV